MNNNITFREATREDCPLILDFIKKLAVYEKMLDCVENTSEMIEEECFNKNRFRVFFALVDGKEVGFCLYFFNYSTFVGRCGLYLEDIFILEEYRKLGIGKKMFYELLRICKENNCGRMEWVCLNWNEPSIKFYKSLGAKAMDDWTTYRLDSETINKLLEK